MALTATATPSARLYQLGMESQTSLSAGLKFVETAINQYSRSIADESSGTFHVRQLIRPLTALVLMSEMTLLMVIWSY